MHILSRSSTDLEQLSKRTELAGRVELQILNEFLNHKQARDIVKEIDDYVLSIDSVHCPLYPGWEFTLDNIYDTEVKRNITETCRLAQMIAERKMSRIYVVFHSGFSMSESTKKKTWGKIKLMFKDLVRNYPLVDFLIENLMPYRIIDNVIYLRNGYFHDAVEMSKELGESFGPERFGTTLDISHAEVTCNFFNRLFNSHALSIESYFHDYKDSCKLLHMSDTIGLGFDGKHGIAFNPDRTDKIKRYLDLYDKYNYACDIVLEVREDDYNNPINFERNYKDIKRILKQ